MRHISEEEATKRFGVYLKSEDETNYAFNEENQGMVDYKASPDDYVKEIQRQLKERGITGPFVPDTVLGFIDMALEAGWGLEVNRVKFDGDAEVWFLDKKE